MRKIILALAVASLMSCQQKGETNQTSNDIVFIDYSKLLKEYEHAKDIEAKYKAKSEQLGKELDEEIQKFRADVAFFEKNAQAKGPQWTQQTGAALQEREQRLMFAQQAMMQQLQEEGGKEMDSLIKQIKDFINSYGKEKGYDYILSTDGAGTVLYAKEGKEITSEVVKLLNDKYKANLSKEETIEIEEDSTSVK